MSRTADVDGMRLTMPVGWWVWKYDDSSFHRNQFQAFAGGSKAMDAVALADDGTLWLIEVKDYRRNRRSKPISVFAEVAAKVRATLAGLAVARVRANDPQEKTWALQALACQNVRVALQLAQPVKPSRLFPLLLEPADAQLKLRQAIRPVDAHPQCVVGNVASGKLPWTTVLL
jgi:hypothetical protein